MKRTLLSFVIILAHATFLSGQQSPIPENAKNRLADASALTVKSEVNEVRLAFAVTDGNGQVVTRMSPADLEVVDNGQVVRSFRSFRSASESPLNLVILVDSSGSVATEFPRVVAELNRFFTEATWGPNDRVSMVVFGGNWPILICAMKCGNEVARLPLKSIRAGGATPLYDAIVEATKLLSKQQAPESRPALVLFSDGYDTISLTGAEKATDAALGAEAGIYSKRSRNRLTTPQGEAFLAYLTEKTGGLRFPSKQSVDVTLTSVVRDLRSGFVLTYELPRTGVEQHNVQILATNPAGLKIRSRNSYRVPPARIEQSQGTP